MKSVQQTCLWTAAIITLVGGSFALGADWANWRGPTYDGISPEKGFKTTWTQPPKTLWEQTTGSGFSSFAVVKGKAYTCGTKDKQQTILCLDANTGKLIWEKAFEAERVDSQGGDGPRATPTIDDGRLYMLGGHGLLVCWDANSGEEIWKLQFNKEPKWGYAGSVLIEGDMAIACPGGSQGGMLALDKKTGKEIWKCTEEPAGYATPFPFTVNNKRYVLGFLAKCLVIAETKTGKKVWQNEWQTDYDVNAAQPIFHDGYLFVTSGYRTGCALFKLKTTGSQWSGQEVWRSKVLMNKIQSCVLVDGVLYGGDQRAMKAVDFLTGKELWSQPQPNATIIYADGHLVVLTEKGTLMTARPSTTEFKPIAEAEILKGGPKGNQCWTIPTLCNGKLYARNLKKAVCIDMSAKK